MLTNVKLIQTNSIKKKIVRECDSFFITTRTNSVGLITFHIYKFTHEQWRRELMFQWNIELVWNTVRVSINEIPWVTRSPILVTRYSTRARVKQRNEWMNDSKAIDIFWLSHRGVYSFNHSVIKSTHSSMDPSIYNIHVLFAHCGALRRAPAIQRLQP